MATAGAVLLVAAGFSAGAALPQRCINGRAEAGATLEQAQRTDLTRKLEMDCCAFAVGVVFASSKLLMRFFLPLWRQGWRASCRDCRGWCHQVLSHSRRWCLVFCARPERPHPLKEPLVEAPCIWGGCLSRLPHLKGVSQGKPTAFKNYFIYLGTCCFAFLVLFVINEVLDQLFQIPALSTGDDGQWDGREDVVAGFFFETGWNLLTEATGKHVEHIFMWKFTGLYINGIVFLAFTFVLERWCDQPEVHEKLRRTIWVHGLPVRDQRLNPLVSEPFRLTFDELMRVENEVGTHFNNELMRRQPAHATAEDHGEWVVDEWDAPLPHHERREPSPEWSTGNYVGAKGIFKDDDGKAIFVRKVRAASRIEAVWVTPAVKKWRSIAERLEEASTQEWLYHTWLLAYQLPHRTSCWDRAWCRWYRFRNSASQKQVRKLEVELLRVRLNKLRMCGSAFVTFREVKHCQNLLGSVPMWWHFKRWLCWFNTLKFGHVPFTSVTLEYEPAPHPDDINWQNMDTPRWWSEAVFVLLTFILIVFLAAGQAILMWILSLTSWGDQFTQHFASLILVFVNRTVLPFPVEWIALAGKFRRKSEGELRQMHLNFWLLILNTIVVPLLGVQIAQQIPEELKESPLDFVRCVSFSAMKLPKRLFIGYLFDVTFLVNLYQVVAGSLFLLVGVMQRKLTASLPPRMSVLPPEAEDRARKRAQHGAKQEAVSKELALQPEYSFGYYYAWTLSLVALTLLSSGEVPRALFVTALCFCTKIIVDACNVVNEVYLIGPEHEGVFVTWAIFYLRLCVSGWWLMMAWGIQQLCADKTKACPAWVDPACWVLVALGGTFAVLSVARVSFASAVRRFHTGRLSCERELDGEAAHGSAVTAPEAEISWDATPERLRDSHRNLDQRLGSPKSKWKLSYESVEKVIEAVRERPFLEGSVQRFLKEGQSVQEVQHSIRRANFRPAKTLPANPCASGGLSPTSPY